MKTRNLLPALAAAMTLILFHRAEAQAQLVPLQQATATFSQNNYDIASAIDGITEYPHLTSGGWAVLDFAANTGSATAVFETADDVGFPGGTILSFTLFQTHWNPGHTLGRFRLSVTASPRSEFADGLVSGGDVTADWVLLTPHSLRSSNGITLTTLGDSSILASGETPAIDTYVVEAATTLTNITGIRIEMMEDASLPFNGPGRWPNNGNFVLSELELRASPVNLHWTNTLGGSWHEPSNWSPNRVPDVANHVFITAEGTYTVVGIGRFSSLHVGAASGTQTLNVLGGGNIVLNGPVTFATNTVFDLSATIYGGPSATITVHGHMNWVGGLLNEPVSLTIASNAILSLSGASKDLNAFLTNAGTVLWTAGDIRMSYYPGGAIFNQLGGVFDVQCDQGILFQRYPAQFVNAGVVRKSASAGTTWFDGVPFINTGKVEVQSGILDFRTGLTQAAGSISVNGGDLANVTAVQAGSLEGSGRVFGNLAMSGQISPGFSAGRMDIQGNYLQSASGSCRIEIGGTSADTTYDQVLVASNATLAGAIHVCSLNGFIPAPGDRFEIMRFASMSGGVTFSGLNIANGVRLEPVISSTNIVLVATNAPFDVAGIYWTNTLGGSWSDAMNWSPNQAPGPADTAYIIQDGTYTVTMYGIVVSNLIVGATCGTQTVVIPGIGFCDTCNARVQGQGLFASNTVLNVAGGFNSAILAGNGHITVHGQMNLTGAAQLDETLKISIASNGVLNFSGTSHRIEGVVSNAGRINWSGSGNIRLDGGARIHNLAGGVFDVQNDQVLFWNVRGGVAIYNAGLFRKSGGIGTTTITDLPLFNSGTVEVASGTLDFAYSATLQQRSGTILLNGGSLDASGFNQLKLANGLLAGSGKVRKTLTVAGQISPGFSAGRLEIEGHYRQTPSGSYNVELGGRTAGTNYDQITISGLAELGGTINVCSIGGFTPVPGDRFEIMRYSGGLLGSPDVLAFQGLDIANGVALVPEVSSTNIVLVATSVPLSPSPRLNVARNGDALWVSWPQGYPGFQLYSATNLVSPIQWSPVSLSEPNRAILAPSGPATFYRLVGP